MGTAAPRTVSANRRAGCSGTAWVRLLAPACWLPSRRLQPARWWRPEQGRGRTASFGWATCPRCTGSRDFQRRRISRARPCCRCCPPRRRGGSARCCVRVQRQGRTLPGILPSLPGGAARPAPKLRSWTCERDRFTSPKPCVRSRRPTSRAPLKPATTAFASGGTAGCSWCSAHRGRMRHVTGWPNCNGPERRCGGCSSRRAAGHARGDRRGWAG